MEFSILVLETFGRLSGVRSFVDLLDRSLPESEWSENEALKQKAEDLNWAFDDFDVERQALDERFQFWLPRYTAYSAVTLLFAVLETQLVSCAKLAATQRNAAFQPADLRGNGIESAVLYLKRLGVFDARADMAWPSICDLRDLRHLIVHRAGTKGQSEEHRKTAQRLAAASGGRIVFPESDWSWYGEVWISVPLCRELIETIEGFFDRVVAALGLPPRFKVRAPDSAG